MAAPAPYALETVNAYAACKQHLHPRGPGGDVVSTTRDLVCLHSTSANVPYLSLWARIPGFSRGDLERETYERRTLARLLCMRDTLFVVPSDEFARFYSAYATALRAATNRMLEQLLAQADLGPPKDAGATLERLRQEVMAALTHDRALTVEELGALVPELRARVKYGVGRAYVAELTIGSRLVPGMCSYGSLVRTYPRGTWRSNLWHYARLDAWLPEVDLDSVDAQTARTWLVHQYLRTFGPATAADAQWWTGLAKGEISKALARLGEEVTTVQLEGLGDEYFMLVDDAACLAKFEMPDEPHVFLLPALDPYIMGYQDRRRFLEPERKSVVFDYAGNARRTVWAGGRVVGTWREAKRGKPVFDLFATISADEQTLLDTQLERLTSFLNED